MQDRRGRSPIPPPLLALLFSSIALAAFQNDFSSYPKASQQCLSTAAAASGCSGDTLTAMNSCLCGNGGNFVLKSAACIGSTDSADLRAVYETMQTHCSDSNTALTVSQAQFFAAVTSSATSTTASKTSSATKTSTTATEPSTTTSATSTPTDTNDPKAGLSAGAKAGIALGVVALVFAAVSLLIFFILRRRRWHGSPRDESDAMLTHNPGGGQLEGGVGMGDGPEADNIAIGSHHPKDWKTDYKWWRPTTTPSPGFNWETPYAPPLVHPAHAEQDEVQQSGSNKDGQYGPPREIYELPSSDVQAPIEMHGRSSYIAEGGQRYSGAGWGVSGSEAVHELGTGDPRPR